MTWWDGGRPGRRLFGPARKRTGASGFTLLGAASERGRIAPERPAPLPQWEPTWSAGGTLHLRDLEAFAALTWYGRLFDLMNIRYLPQGLDPPPPTEWNTSPGTLARRPGGKLT